MPTSPASSRAARARLYRRRRLTVLGGVALLALVIWALTSGSGTPSAKGTRAATTAARVAEHRAHPRQGIYRYLSKVTSKTPGDLAPGSDPSVLPGPVLIADKLNNRLVIVDREGRVRWVFPRPGDLAPGQSFQIPDDAFFSPNGKDIIATQEDDFVISVIDIATHKIIWRYGHPGVSGSAPNYLWNPDDAMILRDNQVVAADIKNCRIIRIPFGAHALSWVQGTQGVCYHSPPSHYGSPNGVFPLANGNFLVTEINGDWVDEITPAGKVLWSTHPPSIAYPSDSSQAGPNRYITVDYSTPGQVAEFNQAGQTLWRYNPPSGPGELSNPSLGVALPNGDVMLNDDYDHRVIVIDPKTDKIVWQYGHDKVAGTAPGYLNNPDGFDLAPPYSYADRYQPALAPSGARSATSKRGTKK